MISVETQRTILLALYPLFKEEVYRRRDHMMRWTAVGAAFLFAVVSGLLLVADEGRLSTGGRVILACAIVLLAGTFMWTILQQQHRHRQAKQILIDMEKALGLYDQDLFLHQRSLYPDHWQTDWMHDKAAMLSILLLGLFTMLAIAATAFVP
jgi:K+ transporter